MTPITIKRLKISTSSKTLVDLSLQINKSTALVGASGSGKSLTLKALLGLTPPSLTTDIAIDAPFPLVRGQSVTFVPQNPFTALSPLTKIGRQFFAPREEVLKFLSHVHLPVEILDRFPSQLSGGQLQRVVLAMALLPSPKLLLLDEPTTALDTVTKHSMIDLINTLQEQQNFSLLYVTHDLRSIQTLCDHTAVIREGSIVEEGPTPHLIAIPSHPYTQALYQADFASRSFRQ